MLEKDQFANDIISTLSIVMSPHEIKDNSANSSSKTEGIILCTACLYNAHCTDHDKQYS